MKSKLFSAFAILLTLAAACTKEEDKKKDPDPTPEVKTPVIKAQATQLQAKAGTYTLNVTVENAVEGSSLSASVVGDASWLTVGTPTSAGVPLTVSDNLSTARSAKVKISYPKANDVTVDITQAQWAWSEFNIAVNGIGPFGATVTVTRKTGYNGGYFFEVLDKATFSRYVDNETHAVGEFAYGEALYQSDVAYLNSLASKHGHALEKLFPMLPSMYSKDATATVPYTSLEVDSDYVFIVYGMADNNEATRKTPICLYEFHTGYSTDAQLTFSGSATEIAENWAQLKVSASNNTDYWYMDWVSEIQMESTTYAQVMQKSINNAKTLLGKGYKAEEILCHGTENIQATDLMPGTKYYVVAWGMTLDMESTTAPVEVFSFTTKSYAIADNCRFTIEPVMVEDMDIKVKITPTNLNTRYYVAFVAKSLMAGYTDEQAAQRIINMETQRINNGYYDVENLSWVNLPGMGAGVREVWGRRDEGWTFTPNHDYRVYAFGVDNFGIRSTAVDAIDVTTANASPSDNHFSVTIDKNSWLGIDYTVTPEIADEYWMPFVAETSEIDAYFRNADGSLKEKELFEWVEEYYEDEINYYSYLGTRQLHQHVTPATNYSLFIFGYAGTYTTKIYEWKVSVPEPPLGKSTADFTYSYELFRGEDLAAINSTIWPHADFDGDCIMVVRVQPTENAKHYYYGIWPPKENFQDQGGQYYLMTLDMNPDVSAVDKTYYRTRPWWYGVQKDYKWVIPGTDTIVNHYPWTFSGWAEDADGNYGPWHYEYFIPVPVPKGQETGNYEVGYTQAYDFWSAPAQTAEMQVYSVTTGAPISVKTAKHK